MASTCSSCAAPIIWTVTAKSKNMPVDAEPTIQGKFVVRRNGKGVAHSRSYKSLREEGKLLGDDVRYESHWATCPTRDQHRKKG